MYIDLSWISRLKAGDKVELFDERKNTKQLGTVYWVSPNGHVWVDAAEKFVFKQMVSLITSKICLSNYNCIKLVTKRL